jgi:diguanylate cyclase (GGDEF)-like protein/PAS domain S-box-containing protein
VTNASAQPRAEVVLVGDLGVVRTPLDPALSCADVDAWFRADPELGSVLVRTGAGVGVVNRSAFYQVLVGRLGYGWALHHRRRIGDLDGSGTWLDAHVPAELAAASLLCTAGVSAGDDVGVRWADGRVGTLRVSTLFAELSRIHVARVDQLALSERRFRALVQSSTDVVAVLDGAGIVQYLSPAAERVTGGDPARRIGTDALALVHPDDRSGVRSLFGRALVEPGVEVHGEFRMQVADGTWATFAMDGRNLLDDPAVRGIVVNYRDVTEPRRLEAELRHQALHDPLTGVANRALFLDRVHHALDRRRRHGEPLAVLFCDLDHFKAVNDTHGHPAGDELLRAVAARIGSALRVGDTLARFGGDEFAVLLEGTGALEATAIATAIQSAVREPLVLVGTRVVPSMSIGVGPSSGEDLDEAELIRRADVALYRAKRAGRDRAVTWDESCDGRGGGPDDRLALDLRGARAAGELALEYQPIYAVAGSALVGVEALLRWHHPDHGRISPAVFVPLAEASGHIVEIGRWVLDEACRQVAAWDAVGVEIPVVSVNLSARQLTDDALVDDVADALRRHDVAPWRLQLEVTETALMADLGQAQRVLARLHDAGCRVAIDDFGTGYSSLAYLHRLPADTVKLDRSFIELLGVDTDTIVSGIISLAHALHLQVIAEGVETAAQLATLAALRADQVQGFLLARPVPPDRIADLARAAERSPGAPAGSRPGERAVDVVNGA